MVPVHVAHEEVNYRHVHEIPEPPALVVGGYLPDHRAVVGLGLPLGLPAFVVAPSPGMPPHLRTNIRT